MPTIFGDMRKKISAAGSMGGGEVKHEPMDGGSSVLTTLAKDLIQAIKDDAPDRVASVLKSIHRECESYKE